VVVGRTLQLVLSVLALVLIQYHLRLVVLRVLLGLNILIPSTGQDTASQCFDGMLIRYVVGSIAGVIACSIATLSLALALGVHTKQNTILLSLLAKIMSLQ
jgi:hypothetical protein